MKRYLGLIVIMAAIVAIAAIVRFMPPDIVVVERDPVQKVTVYDTVKIISTPDGKNFRARRVELNKATQEDLIKVYGIGEVFSKRIVEYRNRLGGFYLKEQLKEVKGITDEVFHNIEVNFWIDTLAIQKINLNFATRERLEMHPYFTKSMAKRVVEGVEMKGGYETLGQLLNDNILLPKEAQKIAPYVVFGAAK